MDISKFQGLLRHQRRGGWSARALLTRELHGQLFDTMVGPQAFGTEAAGIEWLRKLAAERAPGLPASIVTLPPRLSTS